MLLLFVYLKNKQTRKQRRQSSDLQVVESGSPNFVRGPHICISGRGWIPPEISTLAPRYQGKDGYPEISTPAPIYIILYCIRGRGWIFWDLNAGPHIYYLYLDGSPDISMQAPIYTREGWISTDLNARPQIPVERMDLQRDSNAGLW